MEMEAIEIVNRIALVICAVVIVAAICFRMIRMQKSPKEVPGVEKNRKKAEWVVFAVLMGIAFIIRVWQFGSIPAGMNQDGAMAAVDAKALADYATDRYGMYMPVHFTAWGYGQMSVLLSYLMVPFIKLFGLSAVTARLPMLLLSMCGVATAYFLMKRFLGVRAAQFVLAFLVINPWHFMQSRWALDCNVFPHMFLFGVFFMMKGIAAKRRYLYLSMVFYALCMYSYGISFYTVPVFLLAACIYIFVKKVVGWKEVGISVGVYALISWPIYTTMVINAFQLKTIETPFFTMPFFPDSIRAQDILFFAENKWEQLGINIKSMFLVLIEGDMLPWNTVPEYGTMYICSLLFVPVGICYVIHRIRSEEDTFKKTGCICLLFFFGIGILDGIITAEANVNQMNIIQYPIIFFVAVGIFYVYESRKKLALVIVPVYLVLGTMFLGQYFTEIADMLEVCFFGDFIEAVQELDECSDCPVYCITPGTPYEESYELSEILTLYALRIDAKYYQGKTLEDGKSYFDKFQYRFATQTKPDSSKEMGYVVYNTEVDLFSEKEWYISTHDSYSTIIPLDNYKGN